MKIERGDVGVGVAILAGVAITVASALWLTRPDDHYFALFVDYDQVEGLNEQTPVRLGGFAVGRIAGIEPQMTETGSVVFRVELRLEDRFVGDSALFIPAGTVARVAHPPVVGSPFIVLETPAGGGAPVASGAMIPGLRTDPFLDQIQVLTGQLSFTVTETLLRATTLMDSVESTLSRLGRTIDVAQSELPEVLASLNASVTAAEQLTVRVQEELDQTAPSLRAAVDSATALLGDSRRVLATTGDLMETATPEVEVILANLDSATYLLSHFVTRISQKPLRILTGVGPPPRRPVR